jgi:ERCC4-related helicase
LLTDTPSVPLVNQQARVLANNLAATVIGLHGNGKHDLWQRAEWQEILAQKRVIVCTPAVLHNALSHRYVRIRELSLLIFDEGM